MDTKLFARIGAVVFVAVALTMTALQLREEPKAAPTEVITVFEPDSDPLPAKLRACAAMGETALAASDCRAAWAEKRRRFLGQVDASASEGPLPAAVPETPVPTQIPAEKGL